MEWPGYPVRHLLSGWLARISVSSRLQCQHLLQLTASQSPSFSGSRESHPEVQLYICPKTCEDPRHFSRALSLHSFLLLCSAYKCQLLSSPSGALPRLYFPAFRPQRPLSWKLGWSGTNLCISFLSRNTVLHFLFSDTWKGCFSMFCGFVVTYDRGAILVPVTLSCPKLVVLFHL